MARTGVNPGVDRTTPPPETLAESDQVLFGVANRRVMALVRIVVGVMWLSNLGWKTPTDFGVLHNYTRDAVSHPVVAPFSWFVQHAVLPHFSVSAWTTLFVETLLAASLLTGLFTRLFGAIGVAQAAAIGMSVAHTPGEWPWSYYLMMLANLVVIATAAGRTWGLDELVRPLLRERRSTLAGWLLRCT
jgi:thiosulfate dehydrogenase [quinone] large subunit